MRKAIVAIAVLLIVVAAVVVPVPFLVVSPGEAVSVPQHIQIEDPPDEITGDLLLTAVALHETSALGAIVALIDDDHDVVSRQQVIPPGVDEEEYVEAQRRLFEESGRVAVAVGARAAGVDVEVSGDGARIAGVVEGGPADGELREGDVVVAVDGDPVDIAADLVAATSRLDVGDTIELTVERGDERRTASVELGRISQVDRPALGVAVATVGLEIELPHEVEVDGGRIGGPSAGLMIALTGYDLLDDGDLTDGRVIAGTGTIDLRGRVGAVGGVTQKVETAVDAGAEIFLVGEGELAEAQEAAGDRLEVVGVATLDDAIAALER